MNIHIKRTDKSHLNDIIEIEALSYGPHHWSYEAFEGEIENNLGYYICALDDNEKVLGYLGLLCVIDEAHITTLAVHPDFRRHHIAQILLLNMLDYCYSEKIKYITLEVRTSNIPAQKLYEKFGFSSLGVRKQYYQDNNEDAIIMWTQNIFNESYKQLVDDIKSELEKVI